MTFKLIKGMKLFILNLFCLAVVSISNANDSVLTGTASYSFQEDAFFLQVDNVIYQLDETQLNADYRRNIEQAIFSGGSLEMEVPLEAIVGIGTLSSEAEVLRPMKADWIKQDRLSDQLELAGRLELFLDTSSYLIFVKECAYLLNSKKLDGESLSSLQNAPIGSRVELSLKSNAVISSWRWDNPPRPILFDTHDSDKLKWFRNFIEFTGTVVWSPEKDNSVVRVKDLYLRFKNYGFTEELRLKLESPGTRVSLKVPRSDLLYVWSATKEVSSEQRRGKLLH
jgi:hypothetical protein